MIPVKCKNISNVITIGLTIELFWYTLFLLFFLVEHIGAV